MSAWIDFRKLREDVDFEALLRHYQVKLRIRGIQGQGFCPLPTHRGQGRSPSFSVNFDKKIWQCFGCKARGNAIDFAVRMEGKIPSNTIAVREVAEILQQKFVPAALRRAERPPQRQAPMQDQAAGRAKASPKSRPAGAKHVLVNPPLDFKLQNLDAKHPYLKSRHFKPATIAHFGLGFCSLGMMKDRIAIPLHDAVGKLIGYAGRVIDDSLISEDNPKYKLPGKRDYREQTIEFRKSEFLYNGFRIKNASNVLVVEGFPACWWLWQCGYPQVVALMGSSCSGKQADLVVASCVPDGTIWILTDGDDAGVDCAESVLNQIDSRRETQWLRLDEGIQPTDLSIRELRKLIPIRPDKSGTTFKQSTKPEKATRE